MATGASSPLGTGIIDSVLADMSQIVEPDGGKVTLRRYDPNSRTLVVEYQQGRNDNCDTCTIDAGMLRQFIVESLRSHDVLTEEVFVEAV